MFMPLWNFCLICAWICKRSANSYAKSRCLLFLFTLCLLMISLSSPLQVGTERMTKVILDGLQFPYIYYPACQVLKGLVDDIYNVPVCLVLHCVTDFFPSNFRVNIVKSFLLIYDHNGYRPHPNSRF